jgi:dTMP kinase
MTNSARPYGHVIAVEGIDGSGKSSLAALLVEHLRDTGQPAQLVTRYTCQKVTQLWKNLLATGQLDQTSTALLAAADWVMTQRRVIELALKRNEWVIADRYRTSQLVHFQQRDVNQDLLIACFSNSAPADLVLYLDLPPQVALKRIQHAQNPELKPDIWECGLDHQPDLTLAMAWRHYHNFTPDQECRKRAFVSWQTQAQSLFDGNLDPILTHKLDATANPDEVMRQALVALEPLLSRAHRKTQLPRSTGIPING